MAIDGPISYEGMRYAQGCSSRAEVSRYRWQNTYDFGDFRSSEDTLLKHYDAQFYIANWGSVRLALAFPEGCLSQDALRAYARPGKRYEKTLSTRQAGSRCIVSWERNEEQGSAWTKGEGILDGLIGVRSELMQGDYRALFLGWLADFNPDDGRDPKRGSMLMPPIPPGLNRLSPAQAALIEQIPIDPDALAVAAELSKATVPDPIPVASVIEKLPETEVRVLLKRVAEGDGAKVVSELNRLTCRATGTPEGPAITCAEFAARALAGRNAREERESKAAAAREKREQEARRQHLASVLQRADTLWAGLDALMDQKIASAYDQAAAHLQELRDADEQAGETARFQQKLAAFRERYARRPAMLGRIAEL